MLGWRRTGERRRSDERADHGPAVDDHRSADRGGDRDALPDERRDDDWTGRYDAGVDRALGDVVPAVAGFSLVDADREVPWHPVPAARGRRGYHAGIAVAGDDIGRLLVVRDPTGGSAFDRYVETLFDGSGAQFQRGSVQTEQGTFVTSNGAPPTGTELDGAAVLRADDPDGASVTPWAGRDQELLWLVRRP